MGVVPATSYYWPIGKVVNIHCPSPWEVKKPSDGDLSKLASFIPTMTLLSALGSSRSYESLLHFPAFQRCKDDYLTHYLQLKTLI